MCRRGRLRRTPQRSCRKPTRRRADASHRGRAACPAFPAESDRTARHQRRRCSQYEMHELISSLHFQPYRCDWKRVLDYWTNYAGRQPLASAAQPYSQRTSQRQRPWRTFLSRSLVGGSHAVPPTEPPRPSQPDYAHGSDCVAHISGGCCLMTRRVGGLSTAVWWVSRDPSAHDTQCAEGDPPAARDLGS